MPTARWLTTLVVAALAGAASASAAVPQTPPVIKLLSGSPAQRAVWGSFCVTVTDDHVHLCVDGVNPEPRWLSVVRPGERITLRFRQTLEASGDVFVYKRGCERAQPRWTFAITGPETRWRVPPWSRGRFELSLGATFATVDGRSGDTSAALGILSSKTRERGLLPNRDRLAC
jgi:hypothetical protein